MRVIRDTDARRTESPAATMTTFASPTQGGAENPIWKVEAPAGTAGPLHHINAQQVWTILDGSATVTVDDESAGLAAGDTIVIPADVARQVTPDVDTGFTAIVTGPAGMLAYKAGEADNKISPRWME